MADAVGGILLAGITLYAVLGGADFGLSGDEKEAESSALRPLAWTAPEGGDECCMLRVDVSVLHAAFSEKATAKSDVFSFGVVLWEMLTRQQPHVACSMRAGSR